MLRRLFSAAAALCAFAATVPAQQTVRPAISGIAFMRVYTSNAEAAQRFYGGTLGLKEQQLGGFEVYPVNASQWVEVVPHLGPEPNGRFAAVAFTTRDAAKLEAYLRAKGVAITEPLQAGSFSVRDPEGNAVIFVQAGSERAVAQAAASPHATSSRIIHVGFVVQDRAREDAFWRDILGFRPYWHGGGKSDTATDYVSLQVPDGTDWLEYMLNVAPDADLKLRGVMDHFSLGVERIEDAVAKLAANHCEGSNCSKTQLGRDGKMQLNVYDPDGTRVEFMEFRPVKEPCCSPFTGPHPSATDGK